MTKTTLRANLLAIGIAVAATFSAALVPTTSYAYDENGSPTTDGTRSFAYDARGRLTKMTSGAVVANYLVGSNGLRVAKTVTR